MALLTIIYALIGANAAQSLFRDSDAGWHIRVGERLLSTGQLPTSDPFSFTRAGAPWVTWEWLADALMGFAHQTAGLPGVAWLYLMLLGLCTWLWIRWTWTLGGSFLLAAAFLAPMLSTANLHWLARPHVFSWCLALAGLWLLDRLETQPRPSHLALAAAFGCLWANLHASFGLGAVILGIYALAAWLEKTLLAQRQLPLQAGSYAALFVAFTAGTLVNPHGWSLHAHVASYLANSALLDRIGEFQSFNFHVDGATQVLLTVLLGAVAALGALAQGRLAHGLLCGVLLAGALRSARGLPLLALLALPVANAVLSRASLHLFQPRLRRAIEGFRQYSANLRTLERNSHGAAWVLPLMLATAGILLALGRNGKVGFPPDQFPVAAAAHVPSGARVLAPDKFGGYLIYRFNGQLPVYFDGRSDFYGLDFMKRYISLVEVRPGWTAELDRHHFTHALLPANYSLISALGARGWQKLHADSTATLLAAPEVLNGPQ